MIRGYKKIISITGIVFFLIFITALQISFINWSFLNLNLFFILVLYFVLTKNNSKALIFAWLGGILTGLNYFSIFGVSCLVFLISAVILIILYRIIFLTLKLESVFFMSVTGILLYHFLDWLVINTLALIKIGFFEGLGFYLFNYGIITELIITTLILLIIFKFKIKNV